MKIYWQYQRDFLNWLEASGEQFLFKPIIESVTIGYVRLSFKGIRRNVMAKLFEDKVEIEFCDENMSRMTLLYRYSSSTFVTKEGKYGCSECDYSGEDVSFPTVIALREDHIYIPLLTWVNSLKDARWVEIVTFDGDKKFARVYPRSHNRHIWHLEEFMEFDDYCFSMFDTATVRYGINGVKYFTLEALFSDQLKGEY